MAVLSLPGEATKNLARCLFNKKELQDACKHLRSVKQEYRFKSDEGLVNELPLRTWKRTVRRTYLQPEQQSARLDQWHQKYIVNKAAFVDNSVAGQARPLVRGGEEGLKKFEKVLSSQLELVHKGMLSGEHCA